MLVFHITLLQGVTAKNMNTDILTAVVLGAAVNNAWHIFYLLYNAMFSGNKDGIWSIDCNKYGEGNLEVIITLAVLILTFYMFFNSLNRLV